MPACQMSRSDPSVYEWDSRHGTVEIYINNGKEHIGEFDPNTGKQIKPGQVERRTLK